MYPLKFENLYYNKIWGGRDFELFRSNLPEGEIGESWDVACHPHGTSVISNGKYKGTGIDELIKSEGERILGTKIPQERFPLLVKLINAKDKLSVQVHPNDEYAKRVEGDMGKTEAWYVVEAFEGANLIAGTKNCTKEQFKEAIKQGNLDQYLNKIDVEPGDVIFVKSGLVHAIGEGVVIAEIQQNSDTTYRVYDYNRGREIHVEKALEVADLSLKGEKSKGIKIEKEGYSKTYYCLCENFSLEVYTIVSFCMEYSDNERFYIFTCVDGGGTINYEGGSEKVSKGDSILIPAFLGKYELNGNMKLIKSYVPNVEQVKKEVLDNIIR
ncbi:MAG: class I mannose-6-phosphate isomerase [Bacillota bacterium]|nr:class I mannose-6-phosphate isomerase [Bacillota bacterium]